MRKPPEKIQHAVGRAPVRGPQRLCFGCRATYDAREKGCPTCRPKT